MIDEQKDDKHSVRPNSGNTIVVPSLRSKYSLEFERDFKWYLKMRVMFNFDGALDYFKRTVQIYKRKTGDKEYQLLNEMPFATFKGTYPAMVSGNSVKQFSDGMFFEYGCLPCAYPIILFDKNGVSGKEAFFQWDSNGKILPTKHPNLLHKLLKTKGSVNLHIKMYSEDRAKGLFTLIEFRAFCIKYSCPAWFKEAVECQKFKYYEVSTQ